MTRDRGRSPLALLAVILVGVSFVFWATRPVPHGDCVVAQSRISVIGGGPATEDELEEIIRRAYEEAVADGRCEPPWPRWRGWVD
ncbi:hypothetical protein EJ357_16030 [Streptomyces cyaneochromogenes]|uniref:Uncharacterized protein n=1 Tax=Streptomyces cyaneochromogenes TaxID=2496836 RepID=A0A3Q9ES34_9ACTN|nr:hypothetical protein [Streptomyces cyaneochromogenes]AZQ34807.1 hypothetical protein EJ357_16030 [Streptomyces cyaneochromogenes]